MLHSSGRGRVVGGAVNRNERGSQTARALSLLGAARHHANLDIGLASQAADGTRNNLPPHRLELHSRRCAQIGIAALLLAAYKTCQNQDKECHQVTIRHASILPFSLPVGKTNFTGRRKKEHAQIHT